MRTILIFISSALVLGATACGSTGSGSADGRNEVDVVANFYPVFEAAQRVGGRLANVTNLTPPGVEPHDLELTTDDLDEILDADVFLYLGGGFQPAVERAAEQRGEEGTVDLLSGLGDELLQATGSDESDPHVWLDPVLYERIIAEVEDALAKADPGDRAAFERGADTYHKQVEALDHRFETGLADCAHRVIVTSHAAFGYLAARYGLEQEPITGISPEAEPDPRRLAELEDLVRSRGITTIFTEELVSPRVADTLAREAGVKTAVLDPIEGLTAREESEGEDYISIMERNLRILERALQCR